MPAVRMPYPTEGLLDKIFAALGDKSMTLVELTDATQEPLCYNDLTVAARRGIVVELETNPVRYKRGNRG